VCGDSRTDGARTFDVGDRAPDRPGGETIS
jgi:hypothetical protein